MVTPPSCFAHRLRRHSALLIAAIAFAGCSALEGGLSARFLLPRHDAIARPDETGLAFEDCWFEGADGTRRHGWFVPHERAHGNTVVLCHGSAANLTYYFPYWELLHEAELNVFVWDYAGYGQSEGLPRISTLLPDAQRAVAFVAARPDVDARAIGVLGISLGSVVALHLAAHDPRICCAAVEDVASPRANVEAALEHELGDGWRSAATAALVAALALPADCEPIANAACAGARGRPLLFLTGELEPAIDRETTIAAHAAAAGRGELWVMPATGHAPHGLVQHGNAYRARFQSFFRDAFVDCFLPTDRSAEVAAADAPLRDLEARRDALLAELQAALHGDGPARGAAAAARVAAAEAAAPFPPALEAELAEAFVAIGAAFAGDTVPLPDAARAWYARAVAAAPLAPGRHFVAGPHGYRAGFPHADACRFAAAALAEDDARRRGAAPASPQNTTGAR